MPIHRQLGEGCVASLYNVW